MSYKSTLDLMTRLLVLPLVAVLLRRGERSRQRLVQHNKFLSLQT